jgi:CheY-like chemotaxis protein
MRKSVLIVEDQEDTLLAVETLLVCSNFSCRGARTRDEAKLILETGYQPDCVIMDFYMPGMGLGEFLDQTAALKLQLVLTTAAKEAFDVARRFGIEYVLPKPIEGDRLVTVVQKVVGNGAVPGN